MLQTCPLMVVCCSQWVKTVILSTRYPTIFLIGEIPFLSNIHSRHGAPAYRTGYVRLRGCQRLRRVTLRQFSENDGGCLPSDNDLCPQPTMARLENKVNAHTLYGIGVTFVKEFVRSFEKAPQRIILNVDDTDVDTYGAQLLTLFNNYYGECCNMLTLIYAGLTGKMILPLLRLDRRNKSANVFGILRRVVEYFPNADPAHSLSCVATVIFAAMSLWTGCVMPNIAV